RAPHVFLSDGRSLLDALGPAYTLIRFDQAVDTAPLVAAAARSRVPLTLLDVDRAASGFDFPEKLLMVRPDSHIAWRGQVAPREPDRLFDRLRGLLGELGTARRDETFVA
ncbi:monooxygenase, partial [Lactobacillus crispatus]|uniref:aromatic-ring hydroxylase C-terminal domain-containing protein n=1 Tax=Lactobacillus crispatus TaxID=47770 RepID=UPI0010D53FF8